MLQEPVNSCSFEIRLTEEGYIINPVWWFSSKEIKLLYMWKLWGLVLETYTEIVYICATGQQAKHFCFCVLLHQYRPPGNHRMIDLAGNCSFTTLSDFHSIILCPMNSKMIKCKTMFETCMESGFPLGTATSMSSSRYTWLS